MISPNTTPTIAEKKYKELGWDKVCGCDYKTYIGMTIEERSNRLNEIGVQEMQRLLDEAANG